MTSHGSRLEIPRSLPAGAPAAAAAAAAGAGMRAREAEDRAEEDNVFLRPAHGPIPPCASVVEALFRNIEDRVAAAPPPWFSAAPASDAAAQRWLSTMLPPPTLDMLLLLFGAKSLERACSMVDTGGIRKLTSPTGTSFFQVLAARKGRRKGAGAAAAADPTSYLCLPFHFCSCQAFFFDTVRGDLHLSCKHLLAARLASSLQRCQQLQVSDLTTATCILSLRETAFS